MKREVKLIIEVNDENFEKEVIKKSKKIPVVVDFWAPWCFPCGILSPILEKLTEEYNGKFILAKANVDETRNYAIKYGVSSIPNVKFFENEEIKDEFIGVIPEERIKEWLDKNLSKDFD